MKFENLEQENKQILLNFRELCRSYADEFIVSKNRVFNLLGTSQAYSSGIFRESLIRDFLKRILPKSVSIDSGFIYGFDKVETSGQIDIIIWDSSKYGSIFQTSEFVVVPPESVIAIITVKSNMNNSDIESGLHNLSSVIDLDLQFRRSRIDKENKHIFRPIRKYFISYKGTTSKKKTKEKISKYYRDLFLQNQKYSDIIVPKLQEIDPLNPSEEIEQTLQTFLPKLILSIESDDSSFFTGWGPPEDECGEQTFGPCALKRVPYLYPQRNKITSPFEKLIYYIISNVYDYLGTEGWSTVAAWADIPPVGGVRTGDSSEIVESEGVSLVDFNNTHYIPPQ